MKAVILAGGYGTRLSEETGVRPKPMVDIGGKPMLWHIMKIFSAHGINDFVICAGYKGEQIKKYFADFFLLASDVLFDLSRNEIQILRTSSEPWRVTVIDTGETTMTGGRLKRVRDYLEKDESFCMTYGDGVSDVHIGDLIDFHRQQGTLATVTAVQPPGRFGAFRLSEGTTRIAHFREKPQGDGAWVNGGFFVLEPAVLDYIKGDDTIWEQDPLEELAASGQLAAYRHRGFWHPMDTLRDRMYLEELWKSEKAPWQIWS